MLNKWAMRMLTVPGQRLIIRTKNFTIEFFFIKLDQSRHVYLSTRGHWFAFHCHERYSRPAGR
jgi:hypothetical protein